MCRLDTAKERISELEERSIKTPQTKSQTEKLMKEKSKRAEHLIIVR